MASSNTDVWNMWESDEENDETSPVSPRAKINGASQTSVLASLSLHDNKEGAPQNRKREPSELSGKLPTKNSPSFAHPLGRNQNDHYVPRIGTTNTSHKSECQKPTDTSNGCAKVYYRPPRPSNKEEDVFGQEIETGANFDKYADIPVKITGNDVCEPLHQFTDWNMCSVLAENIRKSGYTNPTPIQKHAIPAILLGRDIMGCAQTGSGKTAAYLVPMIQIMLNDKHQMQRGHPHAVIVTPTRELAIQIYNEAHKFSYGSFLKCGVLYGGTSTRHQSLMIRDGCHILVATPGRLLDFIEKGIVQFDALRFAVLDEADRMLDMGFLPSMKEFMNHSTMPTRTKRQTLMFSATFPDSIQTLAGAFLENYIFIAIGIIGGACADVIQNVLDVKKFAKRDKLLELLTEEQSTDGGTMVFVETKRTADFLAAYISDMVVPTTSIHGDRFQEQRETALADFKANRMKVLICTSVAARGLDIKNVKHVINYDLPEDIDDYVHRIGRTGRVGNHGMATSFFDIEQDCGLANDLVKILHQADQMVPSFLLNIGDGRGRPDQRKKRFGGQDVRRERDYNAREPKAHEPEETW